MSCWPPRVDQGVGEPVSVPFPVQPLTVKVLPPEPRVREVGGRDPAQGRASCRRWT